MTALGDGLARVVDLALEATVVGSFSRIGSDVRSRTDHWQAVPDGNGKVALVTGAGGGIGSAAANELAAHGWVVWLAGRSQAGLDAVRAHIRDASPRAEVRTVRFDLADLAQVRDAAAGLAEQLERLDVLVHNAGSLNRDFTLTADGLELTTQVNVVAPFLLTSQLLPVLRSSAGARVVTVSSGGMYTTGVSVADLQPDPGSYDGVRAYARTKRAQVVLTELWAQAPEALGVRFHSMHPGWVATPGLSASLPRFERVLGPLLRTPAAGADTVVWLASATEPGTTPTSFWHDRRRRSTVRLPGTAVSPEAARGLWSWTAERVAVTTEVHAG